MKTINSLRSKLLALTLALMASVSTFAYESQWCDTWNILVKTGGVHPPVEETYRYQLAQDTVIGNYTYTAVVSKAINDAFDAPRYVAAVRFTDDRKVYIYYDNAEYLLYDFNVQEGDELEVFAGINNYRFGIKTYKCIVTGVEQYACIGCPATITLHVPNHPDDITEIYRRTQWQEGVGDVYSGLLNGVNGYVPVDGGGSVHYLLCAYKGDELKYTGMFHENYGCGDDAEQTPEDLFPTLWGLQRTHTIEMYDHAPSDGKRSGGYPLPFASVKDTVINGKTYLQFGDYVNGSDYSLFFLREENNKVLIYSSILQEDLVLYDYTLKLGDSLPAITSDHDYFSDDHFTKLDKAENIFTYVVTDVSTVTLLDGIERKKWILKNKYLPIIEYVEGIGCYGENTSHSGDFFRLIENHPYRTEYVGDHLVCVSKNGQLLYSMPQEEMNSFTLTCECLSQEDTIAPKDLFPTLWGLQRTVCNEYCGETEEDNSANNTYKQTFDSIFFENDKPYILCNDFLLREEDNKILIYSQLLNKDLVLYDFTLEVGDSLPALYIDYHARNAMDWIPYNLDVVDYNKDFEDGTIYPADTFVVTDVSNVTLLDGKEYKKWTFDNGIEYVEGIGSFGNRQWSGDFFQLIANRGVPTSLQGEHLVCVSKNGQLLYQMDDAEMERLGAECLCDYNSGPKKDNAKNGKIGGRPTPTQWNMLEVETKEMNGTPTILRAETFSYTLENDSIVTKGKTFYQLARQSTKDTAITKFFVGALHFGEDEDNRVYFLRDGVEYVLYDFTAEPGDTIEIFAGINNYPQETTYTHVVVDKDTTEDGACRMFLEVVFPDETTTATNAEKVWLAGLGSIDGIVHNAAKRTSDAHAAPSRSASSETQTSVMLCAWREDSCLYTTNHPDYDSYGCVYNLPTAVKNIDTHGTTTQKLIRNGQLLIFHEGKTYNAMGQEVK